MNSKIKKGLGRGLSSLIGETKVETTTNKLALSDIEPNKFQPRKDFDKEARNYFKEKVYQTVIQRNVRLSEAPSHGLPCVIYDKNCVGSKSYFKLAEEFIKNGTIESAA